MNARKIKRIIISQPQPNSDKSPYFDIAEKYKLTNREVDMLRYLGRGAGNDTIASELYLSDATVRRHIRNLLDKLSVAERQDVTEWLNNYKV